MKHEPPFISDYVKSARTYLMRAEQSPLTWQEGDIVGACRELVWVAGMLSDEIGILRVRLNGLEAEYRLAIDSLQAERDSATKEYIQTHMAATLPDDPDAVPPDDAGPEL